MRSQPAAMMLLLTFCLAWTPLVFAQDDGDAAVADHVLQMLGNKCNSCHGSHLERPKGRFGYVLDLPRIAENLDLIEPGDAELSGLFMVLDDGSMPPRTSGIEPLTDAEKSAVRKWIETGAKPASPEAVKAVTEMVSAPAPAPQSSLSPQGRRTGGAPIVAVSMTDMLIEYAGRFHAAAVHFPIALLLAAALAELLGAAKRTDVWRSTVRYCVWLGALASIVATALGWANAASHTAIGAQGELIDLHRWVGTVASIVALLAVVAVERQHKQASKANVTLLRVLLAILVIGMSASGFLGGAIVKGLDHYAW